MLFITSETLHDHMGAHLLHECNAAPKFHLKFKVNKILPIFWWNSFLSFPIFYKI